MQEQGPEFLGQQVERYGADGQARPDIESGRFDESLTMASPVSMPDRIKVFCDSRFVGHTHNRPFAAIHSGMGSRLSLRTEGTQAR